MLGRRFKSGEKDTGDWPRSESAKSFTLPAYSVSREVEKCVENSEILWKKHS